MKFSRRELLAGSVQTLGAVGALSLPVPLFGQTETIAVDSYRGTLAILQGMTNRESSQFIVLFPKKKKYSYQVLDSQKNSYAVEVRRREIRTYSDQAVEKLLVTGLSLSETYTLRAIDDSGIVADERIFKAMDTLKPNARIAIASCMKDIYVDSRESMWEALAQTEPDMIFLNGDTCYADKDNDNEDEAGFWRRYVDTRSLIGFFRFKKLIPMVACWDDHDYGKNNGDKNWSKKDLIKDIFEIFWDSETGAELKHGPGMSLIITAFGQRFCMTDGRYFKDPGSEGSYWGVAQEEFLFEELEKSSQPAWLMNGTLFFGGYLKWESLEYEKEKNFKQILERLSKIEAPVTFVSGDVHFSEIMQIEEDILGYKTHEFVSSSMHSSTFPFLHLRAKNKRRLDATSIHNFMVFETDFDPQTGNWNIHCRCLGKKLTKACELRTTIRR